MTYLVLGLKLLTVVVAPLHDVVLQLLQTDVVVFALTRLGVGRRQLVAQVRRRRERLGRRAGRVTRRRFDQDAAVVRRRARLVHCGGGRQKSETWRVATTGGCELGHGYMYTSQSCIATFHFKHVLRRKLHSVTAYVA